MEKENTFLIERFQALGCPCEILLETTSPDILKQQLSAARHEAERIEMKFSRYRQGSMVDQINSSQGRPVKVDDETAAVLHFAQACYEMSDGLFDITRRGWKHVTWKPPFIQLPRGFEIDFGGICKEYAADRIVELLVRAHPISTLVNLGGDIAARGDRMWSVGIEDVSHSGQITQTLHLRRGGVATSGTTRRPGHIVNPKTRLPIQNAPEAVTVAATTCTEAGFWSTLAVLHGAGAEAFLNDQSLEAWCYRSAA